jgi:Spy/CpxP family protein refolding chaperone
LIFFGLALAHQGPKPSDGVGVESPHPIWETVLNPTADDKDQIRVIRQRYQPSLRAALDHRKQARHWLQDALLTPEITPSVIEQKIQAVATSQDEIPHLRATMEYEINRVLTPPQLTRLKDYPGKRQQLRQEFQQRRRSILREISNPASE